MSLSGLQSNNVGDDFYSHITGQERGRWVCVEGVPMGRGVVFRHRRAFHPNRGSIHRRHFVVIYSGAELLQHVLGNLPVGGIASITRSLTHLTATRCF